MSELEWIKEARHWFQGGQAEKSARGLSDALKELRQNVMPLNQELKELNSNAKKSKELLNELTKLQKGVEKQTNWLIALTIVMVILGAIQIYLAYLALQK